MDRKKLLLTLTAFIITFFMALTANAALELTLTQGADKAIAVAFVPEGAVTSSSQTAQDLLSVIKNDLQNSGRFRLQDGDQVKSSQAIDYNSWRSDSVDNVVRYSFVQKAQGKVSVSIKLYDIYGKSLLFSKKYSSSKKGLRRLSHHIADAIYAKLMGIPGVFSTRIAYVLVKRAPNNNTRYYLEVADADGFHPRSLLKSREPVMSPAWSPDGKSIAYVSFERHRASIYVQNIMSGKRQKVSSFPGINGAPAWSHDGKNLAVVLTKTGVPKIYLLNLATRHLTQLTKGYSLDTEPNFAPDDKSLVFTSNRGGGPQIYQVNLVTKKVSRVTYSGRYNARASFSPNGKTIVMLHEEDGLFNIAVQDLASGRVINLSKIGYEESPSFAPNGAMIVYATNEHNKGILAEVSIDGKVMLKLPSEDGEVQEPAWGLPY